MNDTQEKIQGTLNYATALYEKSTIERMSAHYLLVLEQMVNDYKKSIKDYSLLSKTEYQQIVIDWNQTEAELRAAMDGLRDARHETEEMRRYIESINQT